MTIIYIIGGIIGLILVIVAGLHLYSFFAYPPLRPKEEGFKYVHVDYDGSVRELYPEEVEYLSQKFDGADGGRPYIKYKYEQRTPDGKLDGYMPRRRVPKDIPIIRRDRGY
ncbi:MAG: hypothetical protein QM668_21885 [Agriterribacter sp.]